MELKWSLTGWKQLESGHQFLLLNNLLQKLEIITKPNHMGDFCSFS